MAHELTIRDDHKVEMAYVGEAPWHKLGTKLDPHQPVEKWIEAAGMDWTVEQTPVQYTAGGETHTMAGRHVLHRSDNHMALGVVSDDYCILHPHEVLTFFDDLVKAVGLELETAGTLYGGKRFWALAKVGEAALIDGRDKIKGYLLLSSSADGLRATEARHTSIRVVCQNTLRISDGRDSKDQVKITHRSKFIADDVKAKLGVAPAKFDNFMTNLRRLADTKLTDDQAAAHTRKLFDIEDAKKTGKRFDTVMELFRGMAIGSDEPGFKGTAWGWLNSVTEAVDWKAKVSNESSRLDNVLFGDHEKLKARALHQALELI